MVDQKDGCIINVASRAGRHVSDLVGPVYTATKTAVVALTHEFNIEQHKHGIRACALCPGEVATDICDDQIWANWPSRSRHGPRFGDRS
jgi:NADP-dependent 3-hydroxy acid dehydrogenase YdfG